MKRATVGMLMVWTWVVGGCAGGSDSAGATGSAGVTGAGNTNGGVGNATGSAGTTGAGGAGGMPLPPEMELESSFEVPVATGHFIWVANPVSGRVAYVDAASLQVRTVEAGNAPTTLAPIPGAADAVIVLNALSDDATILRIKDGALTRDMIAGVAHGANAVAVSGDGRWAIAWTDARRVSGVMPFQGFQDVTVMDLRTPQPAKPKVILSVGFRPTGVTFASDGSKAFAITADGITVIDLAAAGGPLVARQVAVIDPKASNTAPDVSITPDGRLAVVRREGSASFGILDLGTGVEETIPAASAVTDVDLTDNGTRVVAVARDAAEVVVVPLGAGQPFAAAASRVVVQGETIGSVVLAPGGGTALLYSNAVAVERLTVLTLGTTLSYRVVRLHAPVLSAFASAGGKSAVVLHAATPVAPNAGTASDGGQYDAGVVDAAGATTTAPPALVAANAFSLVPLDAELPARIAPTDARPQSVAISPGADRVLVTVRDDEKKVYGVYLGLSKTLEVQHFTLASPPLAVGVVAAAGTGYVAQKHPEGRITFVTLETGEAKTLTGFELGARVVDWSAGR